MIDINVPKHFKLVRVTSQMAILILDSNKDGYYSDLNGKYAISITVRYGDEEIIVRAIGSHFPGGGYISTDVEYGLSNIQMLTDYVLSECKM